jgi:hypothetical protein
MDSITELIRSRWLTKQTQKKHGFGGLECGFATTFDREIFLGLINSVITPSNRARMTE